MKKISKQLFAIIAIISLIFTLTACSIDDIKDALGNIDLPNVGGDVVETPKQEPETGIVVPPKTDPETEVPAPTPFVDYDYYLISGFNNFEKVPSYNMSDLIDEYGYPTINVYLNEGEEFYVMGGEKNEFYGYNSDLEYLFSECEGHLKNPVAGNYQISLIDGKVVAKKILINESFLDHEEDLQIPVVWKNTMFRNYEGMWLDTDGARLFISVDCEGRICYMVVNPQAGFGNPTENDYIRHSAYTSYNSNPAFTFKDIKHALITPKNGFTITVADVFGEGSYADIIYQITGINILDYNSDFIVNSNGINVDDIRLSYDEKTGVVIIEEVEDNTEVSLGLQIQNEYDLLKAGLTTTHTEWTVTGTIVDMQATSYEDRKGYYNVKFIMEVDGVLIGIYNGQVNGNNPNDISGLQVGTEVTVVGKIAEQYTLTSGNLTAEIDFSRPEISWYYDESLYDLYLRGDMNGWECFESHKFEEINGAYVLDLYLEAGQEFKIANYDWSIEYGYNKSLYPDIIESNGNLAAMISGYYQLTIEKDTLSYKKIICLGDLNQDVTENGVGVWNVSGQIVKRLNGQYEISNGWRLYIAVDSDGRIAYMVNYPINGYGLPTETSYLRHSVYSNYRTNPAFSNLSEEYEWTWGIKVDYEFVVPKDGFVITVYDENVKTELLRWILSTNITNPEDCSYNDSSLYNVDDVRVSYLDTGSICITYLEDIDDFTSSTVVIENYAIEHGWENATLYDSVQIDEYTIVSVAGTPVKEFSQNSGKYYTNGQTWRIYQSESASITFESSRKIESIVIEYIIEKNGILIYGDQQFETGQTVDVNSTLCTLYVGNTTEVTNGQVRITSITVNYAE